MKETPSNKKQKTRELIIISERDIYPGEVLQIDLLPELPPSGS